MNIRFGTKLLSIKMILQFILFGLIVGYFSLLFSMLETTQQVFDRLTDYFNQAKFKENSETDWLYESFIANPEEGKFIISRLTEVIPPEQRKNVGFILFYRESDGSWLKLFSENDFTEEADYQEDQLLADWTPYLDRTIDEEIVHHQRVYLGQAEKRILFIDLTPEYSHYKYVAAFQFNQRGLKEAILSQWDSLKIYTYTIVIFSLILGNLFTFNLSRAIRKLTDNALKVAKGEEAVRFSARLHRFDDVGILSRALDTMTYNLNHRAESMKTMNRIDRAVLSSLDRQDLLSQVASFISEQFSPAVVCVLEKGSREYSILALITENSPIPEQIPERFSERTLPCPGENEILFNPPSIPFDFEGPSLNTLNKLFGADQKKKVSVGYPLILDEKVVGIIIISRDVLDDQDRESLRMLADQAGVAMKSLNESKERERLYQGLLLSLTRSIDAKSKWTAGHSERVTNLSIQLVEQINGSRDLKQMVNIGGLLHDIGKLAIPEAILDKPGKLTNAEFEIIRSHPIRGYEILQEIPNFEEAQRAVRSHHERWDGNGYPDGLKGEEIPFLSRIITICDVYDAISEDRPYRKGFTPIEVRDFLLKEQGKLFDPELLDQFLLLLEKSLTNKHYKGSTSE
jgi:putative nucleotidyltransferase with HDIG domain